MVPASYLFEVGIIVVMTVVIWVGSSWLEGASEQLSEHYGLPQVVQGSVVAAVGSSFPELATVAFAALLTNSFLPRPRENHTHNAWRPRSCPRRPLPPRR